MMPVLVDTNVILDVITDDPDWADWSLHQLEAFEGGGLLINPVVYAELCYGLSRMSEVDAIVRSFGLHFVEIPRLGLFLASRALEQYRRAGGVRTNVLPDFFVGGHADADSLGLISRDARRYAIYFPRVRLIAPEQTFH